MSSGLTRGVLYLVFGLSGFSGLIYESVWSHYLKLFLGHAAYAQALVLAPEPFRYCAVFGSSIWLPVPMLMKTSR